MVIHCGIHGDGFSGVIKDGKLGKSRQISKIFPANETSTGIFHRHFWVPEGRKIKKVIIWNILKLYIVF